MLKGLMVAAAIMATLVMPGMALSGEKAPAANLSGKWIVRWLSNDSRNPMTLAQDGAEFSGTYVNDSRDACTVAGDIDRGSMFLKLEVKCPKWDIQMEGFPTLDGKTIVGEYAAYGRAVGGFIMSKE